LRMIINLTVIPLKTLNNCILVLEQGLGITVFGMAYMFVHDGLVHKRFPVGPIANVPYFRRVAAAHQVIFFFFSFSVNIIYFTFIYLFIIFLLFVLSAPPYRQIQRCSIWAVFGTKGEPRSSSVL